MNMLFLCQILQPGSFTKSKRWHCRVQETKLPPIHGKEILLVHNYILHGILLIQRELAPLVEHRTSIAEVIGSNPIGASEFFGALSYFTTAKISFTSILYWQFTHMIFIPYTSSFNFDTLFTVMFIMNFMLFVLEFFKFYNSAWSW